MSIPDPATPEVDWDPLIHRILWEILLTGTSIWWTQRAASFEAARPRPADFTGQATPTEIAAQDFRLAQTARACRAKAKLLAGWGGEFSG